MLRFLCFYFTLIDLALLRFILVILFEHKYISRASPFMARASLAFIAAQASKAGCLPKKQKLPLKCK